MLKLLKRIDSVKIVFANPNYIKYNFSQKPSKKDLSNLSYPYLFGGGLVKGQIVNNKKTSYFLNNHFESNIQQGFKEAYKSIIHCLAEKDMQGLKEFCEPNLLRNLKFRDVELVNPDADIDISFGRALGLCEGTFIRQRGNAFYSMFDQSSANILKFFKKDFSLDNFLIDLFYKADSKTSFIKLIKEDIPILFAFEIFFKSKMKLVGKNQPNVNKESPQIHSVQFEVEARINILSEYKRLLLGTGESKDPKTHRSESLMRVLGENYEWKVGDIDHLLQGNMILID